MPYVQRDENGRLKGIYANAQPGYAEEWLDDNSPELLAYRTSPAPAAEPGDVHNPDEGTVATPDDGQN